MSSSLTSRTGTPESGVEARYSAETAASATGARTVTSSGSGDRRGQPGRGRRRGSCLTRKRGASSDHDKAPAKWDPRHRCRLGQGRRSGSSRARAEGARQARRAVVQSGAGLGTAISAVFASFSERNQSFSSAHVARVLRHHLPDRPAGRLHDAGLLPHRGRSHCRALGVSRLGPRLSVLRAALSRGRRW